VAREGLVEREGLVAGEDLGPPSLRGMAGAKLMGREGRSCDVRTEGLFECGRTWIRFFFFRYDGVCWTVRRVEEERRFWSCQKTQFGSFLAGAMVGAMMAPKL
jgi:hypothetical protein